MPLAVIPSWNARGLLPPHDPLSPVSAERSPYEVSLLDLVTRFGTTPERRTILKGLLDFRSALHAMGLVDGFQWLDGSFLEEVEKLEGRAPGDFDVVTFLNDTSTLAPTPPHDAALDHDAAKLLFKVDSYFVELDKLPPSEVVLMSAYWYSMWSHRRTMEWKGFLQVSLAPTEDTLALPSLTALALSAGATP